MVFLRLCDLHNLCLPNDYITAKRKKQCLKNIIGMDILIFVVLHIRVCGDKRGRAAFGERKCRVEQRTGETVILPQCFKQAVVANQQCRMYITGN